LKGCLGQVRLGLLDEFIVGWQTCIGRTGIGKLALGKRSIVSFQEDKIYLVNISNPIKMMAQPAFPIKADIG